VGRADEESDAANRLTARPRFVRSTRRVSMRRRGLSKHGKNDSVRTFGILIVSSPVVVVTVVSRVPLLCRAGLAALMGQRPDVRGRFCVDEFLHDRIKSPASALRIVSSTSSRANWSRVLVVSSSVSSLAGSHRA
jgi:hypothetical protein